MHKFRTKYIHTFCLYFKTKENENIYSLSYFVYILFIESNSIFEIIILRKYERIKIESIHFREYSSVSKQLSFLQKRICPKIINLSIFSTLHL
jgi:hypothetical protein